MKERGMEAGAIRQRRERDMVVFDVCLGAGANGTMRWVRGLPSVRAAETVALEQAKASAASQALGEFLASWLESIRLTVRPSTMASYRGIVTDHLLPALGSMPLAELSPMQISAWLGELSASGNRRGKTPGALSARTVRYCHQLLRRALADAHAWGLVDRNAAALIRPPRTRSFSPTIWTAEELGRFLAHVAGERLYPAWMLCATTGMRRGEILASAGRIWTLTPAARTCAKP